jgi:hypothetical protein
LPVESWLGTNQKPKNAAMAARHATTVGRNHSQTFRRNHCQTRLNHSQTFRTLGVAVFASILNPKATPERVKVSPGSSVTAFTPHLTPGYWLRDKFLIQRPQYQEDQQARRLAIARCHGLTCSARARNTE